MLAVGRFAFLPMHRRDLERSVSVSGPKTTGGLCMQRSAWYSAWLVIKRRWHFFVIKGRIWGMKEHG